MSVTCVEKDVRDKCKKLLDRLNRDIESWSFDDESGALGDDSLESAEGNCDENDDDDDLDIEWPDKHLQMCRDRVTISKFLADDAMHTASNQRPLPLHCMIHVVLDIEYEYSEKSYDFKAGSASLYLFKNYLYEVTGVLTEEEKALLIQEAYDSERIRFERLKNKFSEANQTAPSRERPRIPEEVRIAVWRRDGGCCSRCGSRERLEYDHIVPISKGGSNTVRNIELLCEACNRSKGNQIQ